jgi:hypothetical protein
MAQSFLILYEKKGFYAETILQMSKVDVKLKNRISFRIS